MPTPDGYLRPDESGIAFAGIQVLPSPLVPEPRPITPGEWAEQYVRWKMRDTLRAIGRGMDVPVREPRWTDLIHTAYLLPAGRAYPMFSLDKPVEMFGLDKPDFSKEMRRFEFEYYQRALFAIVSPADYRATLRGLF